MKTLRVLFVLSVFLVAASLSAGSLVPYKGSVATIGGPIGYCDPGDNGHVGLLFQISGEGHLTQLGEVAAVQSHCLSLTTFAFAGQSTITGADGSSIVSSYVGQAYPFPGGLSFHGETTVIGGTGQFDGATGSGVGDGVASFEPGAVSVIYLYGTVSSVGSLK
jgi:hypothetical protein